jgi:hypothetical protein
MRRVSSHLATALPSCNAGYLRLACHGVWEHPSPIGPWVRAVSGFSCLEVHGGTLLFHRYTTSARLHGSTLWGRSAVARSPPGRVGCYFREEIFGCSRRTSLLSTPVNCFAGGGEALCSEHVNLASTSPTCFWEIKIAPGPACAFPPLSCPDPLPVSFPTLSPFTWQLETTGTAV